jgi:hypothetical protein
MAAGLSALFAMNTVARASMQRLGIDRSEHIGRFARDHFDDVRWYNSAMFCGTAVSAQKHTEIMFRGEVASCYPRSSMGAEGITTTTSHRPN